MDYKLHDICRIRFNFSSFKQLCYYRHDLFKSIGVSLLDYLLYLLVEGFFLNVLGQHRIKGIAKLMRYACIDHLEQLVVCLLLLTQNL